MYLRYDDIPAHGHAVEGTKVYPKLAGLSHNKINNNKHSQSNTKGYGGKTH